MAAAKKDAPDPDAGLAEVQEKADEANEKGYIGSVADPIENKEYSLQSGPDSPSIAEQKEAYAKAVADEDRHPTGNAI